VLIQCPPKDDLLAFHRGTLAESAVEEVGDHLETCPACEALLQSFEALNDPLLAALRVSATISHPGSSLRRAPKAEPDPALAANWPALPGYEIVDTLGRGGMGVIYKARQLRLNRTVALKRLAYTNERQLARARREAETLARLQHPNIVQIFEILEHEGRVYLALEFVDGGPLSARLDGKPQAAETSAQLIETLARAIHHVHQRGIVHRDLKPSNVLLADSAGEAFQPDLLSGAAWAGALPKITDFGIAKQLRQDDSDTRDGDVIGTPSYMAPEQAGGEASTIGPATDVYGLGVLLYEMLTGRVPLLDLNVVDTLLRVRHEEPVPPRRLQPRVPHDLDTICLKCLHKEPSQRYRDAEALADDLRRFLRHEPIRARPTPAWQRLRKWIRRSPAIAALTLLVLVTAALGFSLVVWQWRRAENQAILADAVRHEAQEREALEKEARLQVQRLVARNALSEGVALCENGETPRGLLWLALALEMAEADGDVDLARAARLNLSAWQPYLYRHRADLVHQGWVWSVAFHPDGRAMATTGSYDGTARIWDGEGEPKGEPLRHRHPVWHVAFSPDGKTLLTGSGDASGGEGRLWDASTGQLLASWPHASKVLAVAFHPSGRSCLTLSVEEAVLHGVPDGKPLGRAMKHPRPTRPNPGFPTPLTGAFSPDGKLLVTAGEDGTVHFWDAASGEARGKTLQAPASIQAVAFSPDSRTLLIGCINGAALMWNVATGQPSSPVLRHGGEVRAVAFSPDGALAATACSLQELNLLAGKVNTVGGEVRLWRVPSGDVVAAPLPHPKPVWSLAFSPTGRRLLTGCEDGVARLFVVANGEPLTKLYCQNGTITQVAFNGDGTRCLISGAGGGSHVAAKLWQLAADNVFPRILLHNDDVSALCFSPDNRYLVSGGGDGVAQRWEMATGQPKAPPLAHPHPVSVAVLSSKGRSLFTACNGLERINDTMKQAFHAALWDADTGRKQFDLPIPRRVFCAAFCDEDRALLVGDIEGYLQLYDTASGKPLGPSQKQHGSIYSLAFHNDGRTLLVGEEGQATLWDWSARRQLKRLPFGQGAVQACFYPDKSDLLLLQNGFAQVWNGDGNERKAPPLFQAEGGIHQLTLSPDGRGVLIGDVETRARLWDVATGKRIGPAPGRTDITRVAFSPNGHHFAVAGKRGRVALWQTPQPMQGSAERLRLWTETLAGLELDAQLIAHPLDAEEMRRRRARLEELGGPPADCY
jgi:WD40 repeat protein/serine/threonine protein kinase